MSFVRINPNVFGLEGFLEKSITYIDAYVRELELMDCDENPENCLMISGVIYDLSSRLTMVFGDRWYENTDE